MDLKYFARKPGVVFTYPGEARMQWKFTDGGSHYLRTQPKGDRVWSDVCFVTNEFVLRTDFYEVDEELLPCPICGSIPAITKNLHGHSIDCGGCGLNLWKSCERGLVKIWNQRAKEGAKQ